MTDKECVQKLFKMILPYKGKLIIILICMIVSSIISMIIPMLSKDIMDKGFINKNVNIVVELSIVMLFCYLLNEFIDIMKEKSRLRLSAGFTQKLNLDFFKHLINIKSEYLEDKNNSEILSQIEMDVSAIASLADEKIFYALTKSLSMAGGFIGLCILSIPLALVVVMFIPDVVLMLYHNT